MAARIVIAGGGIAGIEAALGLRELAGDAEVVVVSPGRELVHQTLNDLPWTMGGVVRHPLERLCERLGAELVVDVVEAVDPARATVALRERGPQPYDALLVAVGARRVMSLDHAVVFGSSLDVPAVDPLLDLARRGELARLAVVIPPAAPWSLPAYEVALRAAAAGARAVVVSPEATPLELFGGAAGPAVEVLEAAGVEHRHGIAADTEPGCVVLEDGERVPSDATVALPWMRGPRIEGLPHDEDGFLPTDPWGAVDGVEGVYAAGDATTFPIRQGGLACQQAAVAAAAIARRLGADVPAEPLRPVVRGALPTPEGPLWLQHDLATGEAAAAREPLWDPPHRIAGVRLPAFLLSLGAP